MEPSARVELAPIPYRGIALPLSYDGNAGPGRLLLVDSEGLEPSLSRVRAGCASVALRAHGVAAWGDRRESNPHSGSHRPVRFPYATTTMSSMPARSGLGGCYPGASASRSPAPSLALSRQPAAVRPEGIEPSSTAYRAAALPLCYGRRELSRGGRDRTCDLTVPNRARCRCATPRGTCMAESKGVEPSDP